MNLILGSAEFSSFPDMLSFRLSAKVSDCSATCSPIRLKSNKVLFSM